MTRRVAGAVGRALVDEMCLWLRWALRAVVVLAVLGAAWTWWLRPAVEEALAEQRAQVSADLRETLRPDLGGVLDQLRGAS